MSVLVDCIVPSDILKSKDRIKCPRKWQFEMEMEIKVYD